MLLSMPNEFILEGILSRIVIIKNDISKCKGYRVNLSKTNNKNDLYHAIKSAGINKSAILSGCIFINVNRSRQNL